MAPTLFIIISFFELKVANIESTANYNNNNNNNYNNNNNNNNDS